MNKLTQQVLAGTYLPRDVRTALRMIERALDGSSHRAKRAPTGSGGVRVPVEMRSLPRILRGINDVRHLRGRIGFCADGDLTQLYAKLDNVEDAVWFRLRY